MTSRSGRPRNMDPDDHLDAPAPPPSNREAGASSLAPLLAAGSVVPFPSPVVLRVLPLRGSPAPIGYIYDATPDADEGLLAAASAFFSHQGHQVFHDPCPNLADYRRSQGVVLSVVPVDRLLDHILSSGLELLDGLFAPSPTDSGTAFMAAYLTSPPSATPQLPSSNRSVALGLGSTRSVGSVMGGVGVHLPSSAPPMGGSGVPGGTSAPLVGLPGRRLDPDNGVSAPGHFHPGSGVPTSLGDFGVHPGVSGLDMGGLGVTSPGVSLSQTWGVSVSLGGHPFCMGGILVVGRIRTKGSHPPLAPIMPWVFLTPWLLPAPFAALPSPPWWRFLPLIHPGVAPLFHPWSLSQVIPGFIRLRSLLLAAIWGGVPLLCLPAHVGTLAVCLRRLLHSFCASSSGF